MQTTDSNNLLYGSVPRQLFKFSMPFLLSNVMQTAYALIDMIIVGRFVGSDGLAGVSTGSMVTNLFITLGIGLAMGGQIMLAQFNGAGDEQAQRETIGTTITFMFLLGIALSIPAIILAKPILGLLNTPEAAYDSAYWFMVICLGGTVFVYGYNSICMIFRGLGDSKHPMYFVAVSTIVNILLDFLFVGLFGWGAGGAAAATLIGQGSAFAVSVIYLYKKRNVFIFDFKLKSFKLVPERLKMILKVGLPFSFQFSILMISMLFVISLVNSFGVAASAAYGVGGRIDNFATMPVYAFSSAAATMIGVCIGAGNKERAKSIVNWCLIMTMVIEIVVVVIVQLLASRLIAIFDSDPDVISIGVTYLRFFTFAYIAHALLDSYLSIANGIGFSMLSFAAITFDGVILRILLAYLLANVLGYGLPGVFLGATIAPFGAALIGGIYFYSGRWRNRSLASKK